MAVMSESLDAYRLSRSRPLPEGAVPLSLTQHLEERVDRATGLPRWYVVTILPDVLEAADVLYMRSDDTFPSQMVILGLLDGSIVQREHSGDATVLGDPLPEDPVYAYRIEFDGQEWS